MPRQSRTKSPQKSSPIKPTEVLGLAWDESASQNALARYQQWRGTLSLEERLDELLWSWHLLRPDLGRPTTSKTISDASTNFIPQPIDKSYWKKYNLNAERRHGDRQREARKNYQDAALKSLGRSNNLVAICAVGEQSRDSAWLDACRGMALKSAIDVNKGRRFVGEWLDGIPEILTIAKRQLGAIVDDQIQEFLQALCRLESSATKDLRHALVDFAEPIYPDLHYRRPKAGRPHFDTRSPTHKLRRLKVPSKDIRDLIVAWSLTPIPKDWLS